MYDAVVVGAGLSGCTVAERLASELSARVLVVEKRAHLAGNAYDPLNAAGLRIHAYGPHIFHTNSPPVVAYLSRFTAWRPYEHRVLARVRGALLPIPINRLTINALFGTALSQHEVMQFLAARAEPLERIANSEDAIVSKVGRELYELFFRGYTRKHWGLDPRDLAASVCGRIPTRTNDDDRYFSDTFQAMPVRGFESMCRRMLQHPCIDVALDTDYRTLTTELQGAHIVYTGPIDEYFDYAFGRLQYRSLRFAFETLPYEQHQTVGCINEPHESVAFTRTTEYKHLTGQVHPHTVISREYPSAEGDPYYPIPREANQERYERYVELARRERNLTLVGRLAEYRYYNMDQVVASALKAFERIAKDWPGLRRSA